MFFIVYFSLHLLLPIRYRIGLIVVGSTIFYGYWNPYYTWIPYLLTVSSYLGSSWIDNALTLESKRRRLTATIALLLVPLLIFKYTNFIYNDVFGIFVPVQGNLVDLLLPLGISFVTFTAISYVVDVSNGKFPREKSLMTMLAYILFFPQLIAGPILRPAELIPQLRRMAREKSTRIFYGVGIFTAGLVKKLIFADQIASFVDPVFASSQGWQGIDYLIAVLGFSIQIYCDFSGYTDMAIGLAIILGVNLPANFARPYSAASIVEFWRCWHMTLSRWLRDYLYIPLGGRRASISRHFLNIMITMVLGGLWHGASWTFVLWGAIHGLAIVIAHTFFKLDMRWKFSVVPRFVKVSLTFIFVTFAWIFFRSPDMDTSLRVIAGLTDWSNGLSSLTIGHIYPAVLILIPLSLHRFDDHRCLRTAIRRIPMAIYTAIVCGLWVLSMIMSAGTSAAFVYFDF